MTKYYAVLLRELDGTLIGRIAGRNGETTTSRIRSVLFTKEQATRVAKQINDAGYETAKVIGY